MKEACKGTLFKIGKKNYCVGEKLSKKVNGKTVTTIAKGISKKNRKTSKSSKSSKSKKTKKSRK